MVRTYSCVLALSLVAACSEESTNPFDTMGSASTTGASASDSVSASATATASGSATGSTSGATDSASASDSATDGSTGFKFDVPNTTGMTTGDTGPSLGCDKVDILFVIDDSGSMSDNQDKLTAAFPAMAQTIDDTLVAQDGIDYRIGVMSSNITDDTMCLLGQCGPNYLGRLQHTQARVACQDVPAGKWIEGGEGATAVGQQFTCIASLNQAQDFNGFPEGGSEAPLEATRMGLVDRVMDAEKYNANFLRSDALLVLVIVSDEDDQSVWMGKTSWATFDGPGSLAPVQQYYDWLVSMKGGHPENVVAVAITGPENGGGETDAPRVHQFLGLAAPNSFWTDIGGADYSTPLQEALAVIEGSCDNFIPPG